MAEEDIDNARHAYAALNEAYRTGDPARFLPVLERSWAPDAVFTPAGILPESAPVQGWDGVLGFIAEQMKAFKHGTMWIEPLEYIDGGRDRAADRRRPRLLARVGDGRAGRDGRALASRHVRIGGSGKDAGEAGSSATCEPRTPPAAVRRPPGPAGTCGCLYYPAGW